MQQQSPAQLPEGLAALMALTNAIQQGQASPTTPDGQPTVAAQAAQAMQQRMGMQPQGGPPQGMPPQAGPGVQDVAQGAGMAAQQQAQQQQAMMQQMPQMIAEMQKRQQAMDQGIAGAPGAQNVNMAEGGIVGYSGEFDSYVGNSMGWGRADSPGVAEDMAMDALRVERAREKKEYEEKRRIAEFLQATGAPQFEQYKQYLNPQTPKSTGVAFNIKDPTAEKAAALEAEAQRPGIAPLERQALLNEAALIREAALNKQQPEAQSQQGGGAGSSGAGIVSALSGVSNMIAPAMPGREPAADYSASDKAFEEALAAARGTRTEPATPQEAADYATKNTAARRAYMLSQGVDPDVLANTLKKQQEIAERRQAMYEQQLAGVRERAPMQEMISFLTSGARGGRGLGAIMGAGAVGAEATSKANQARIEELQELQVRHQEAASTAAAALQKMQYDIAAGDYKSAMESRNTAISAENEKKKIEADILSKRAGELGARSRSEAERNVQQRGQDITGRSQDVQMEIQRAQEAVRLGIERMKEERAGDPRVDRLLSALNRDELYKGIVKRMENAIRPEDARAAMQEALAYQEQQRKLFGLPATPAPTPPTYKYDPKTGLQPGK